MAGQVSSSENLKKELAFLGLIDKAREIYYELGERAVLSYIKSSYQLLSKVYHPDLNPKNIQKATIVQQRLNNASRLISMMKDEEILSIFSEPFNGCGEGRRTRKIKLLVVEDEFGLQETYREIFSMEGYNVRIAVDGLKGLAEYKRFEPELIFTDVVMPNMSGLELVSKIRELNPYIKVIYVSGFFGIKRLKKALEVEVSRYGYPTLSKPFKASTMLEIVKEYLGES